MGGQNYEYLSQVMQPYDQSENLENKTFQCDNFESIIPYFIWSCILI